MDGNYYAYLDDSPAFTVICTQFNGLYWSVWKSANNDVIIFSEQSVTWRVVDNQSSLVNCNSFLSGFTYQNITNQSVIDCNGLQVPVETNNSDYSLSYSNCGIPLTPTQTVSPTKTLTATPTTTRTATPTPSITPTNTVTPSITPTKTTTPTTTPTKTTTPTNTPSVTPTRTPPVTPTQTTTPTQTRAPYFTYRLYTFDTFDPAPSPCSVATTPYYRNFSSAQALGYYCDPLNSCTGVKVDGLVADDPQWSFTSLAGWSYSTGCSGGMCCL
jgi:hypothetical protein